MSVFPIHRDEAPRYRDQWVNFDQRGYPVEGLCPTATSTPTPGSTPRPPTTSASSATPTPTSAPATSTPTSTSGPPTETAPVVEAVCVERGADGNPVYGVPTMDEATGTGYCALPAAEPPPTAVEAPPVVVPEDDFTVTPGTEGIGLG